MAMQEKTDAYEIFGKNASAYSLEEAIEVCFCRDKTVKFPFDYPICGCLFEFRKT